ncbi:MAG: DNA-protecting protein DprA [Candidatus Taylorbacteria bacterium]|nr:DNA-protecting protein DprA [Candidatus Taylorbacteria bacterium]
MLEYRYRTIKPSDFHSHFSEMADPPKNLWIAGDIPPKDYKMLCVVGARSYSAYGHEVCTSLINGLEGYPICIVSGLALGIDTIAHEAALEASLPTVAFPGSGLEQKVLYPVRNRGLAERIIENKGCLISEFPPDLAAQEWTFPKRNRLMAGCADLVLIIEGGQRSGTNITARLALDYNRTIGAVPGSIFSPLSYTPHELLREGAFPITSSHDILNLLNIAEHSDTPSTTSLMIEDPP